jgi:hypothetical protein
MPTVIIPAMRDNTTIARVVAQDSGGTVTKMEAGEIAVTAPRRLFFSRRGIESALGYPMRHSAWRGLKERAENGTITIADDMTLLVERAPSRLSADGEGRTNGQSEYTTQRYRTKAREAIVVDPSA